MVCSADSSKVSVVLRRLHYSLVIQYQFVHTEIDSTKKVTVSCTFNHNALQIYSSSETPKEYLIFYCEFSRY